MKIPVRLYKKGGEGTYDVPLEADVIQWLKKQGDHVEEGEELCVLEADKGAFSLVSPIAGVVAIINYQEGTIWRRGLDERVGDTLYYDPPLCVIEGELSVPVRVSDMASLKISTMPPDAAEKISDSPQNKKPKIRILARAATLMQKHNIVWEDIVSFFPDAREIDEKIIEQCIALCNKNSVSTDVVHAVPLARHRAREHHIDLAGERGSGEDGLMLLQDVEKRLRQRVEQAIEEHRQQVSDSEILQDEVHLAPSVLWRTVARNITEGAKIPTVSADAGCTFDVGPLIEFHLKHREVVPYASWFPIMAALVRVLAREEFILLNSYWKEEGSVQDDVGVTLPAVVVARRRVHMGIAYDRGELPKIDWYAKTISGERLKILVLRNADEKSLDELAASTQQLLRAADEKKLSREDLLGYTFIFNNIGALGLKEGSSLMAGKISCMANLGKLDFTKKEGSFQIFFDHRMIDGTLAARFIQAVHRDLVESILPEMEILVSRT